MSTESIDPDTGLVVLVKQPAESREFAMDFTNLLVGSALSSVNSVVQANQNKVGGSTALTLGTPAVDGDSVTVQISDGTDDENYKITAEVVDTAGNTLEGEGMLYVRDQ